MTPIQIIEITLVSLLLLMFAFSIFITPILRKKAQKKQDERLNEIVAKFKPGSKILLASGIRGYFLKIKGDVISVEVAKGVVLKVDKHAVMGVYK